MYNMNKYYLTISALQKSIRWCEVNASRYFARELVNMGCPGGAFNRLMIIAAEDIGLADPSLLLYERQCLDRFNDLIKKYGIKKRDAVKFPALCEIVDRAAIAAAVSYKSRMLTMASFATLYDIYQRETFNENTFTYLKRFADAVENRDEKQALYYAFVAGLFFNSMDRILTYARDQGEKRGDYLIKRWVDEYKRNPELLVLVGVVVMLCRDLNFSHGAYIDAIDQYRSIPIKAAQIPDRAYDKHTAAGKRRGRGLEHFFDEGGSVKNERFPNDWEQTGRDAYFRAESIKLEKTSKIIDAIKAKYENSQKQPAIYNTIAI